MFKIIKNELYGWKKWEIAWMSIATAIIIALSLYWHDSLMGIISATTGVICVICTGKGKLSAYFFGLINSVLYAIIAYQSRYYGEVMLNALYYVPMQFVGFYVWNKNMNTDTAEVNKRDMNTKQRSVMYLIIFIGVMLYGMFLKKLGGNLPFVDAFTTVSSVMAMIISVKMFSDQWILWIMIDIVTIFMWGVSFVKGQDNIATLCMWCVYLLNAIIMYYKWHKESKERSDKNV